MKVRPGTPMASEPLHAGHDHQPAQQEMTFRIEGMHCAACASAVQRAIAGQPGVRAASVSVTQNRATVSGDGLDPAAIVQAVRSSGYDAEPIIDLPAPAELRSEIELRQARNEREWKRRAIIGLGVWVPLELLHWLGPVIFGPGAHAAHTPGTMAWVDWVMLIGATFVIVSVGGGFYRSAWGAAKRGTTNMDTLIAMGATTAYVYSLVIFLAHLFGVHIEQPMYFAESAALLGIISLGHWLEARATARAGSAVRELLELQPEEAEVLDENSPGMAMPGLSTRIVPSAEIAPGDQILIRPGARVPVDGVVVEGESEVDEAVVTGESLPVRKTPGAEVVAGSMNTVGRLIVRATVDGRHTTVARIADMVQRAQSSKAEIQKLADYISSIFVPAVLTIGLVTLLGWTMAGDFATGVIATVTVLIISCPCALGLATPMAVMVGAGAASKSGVLVKSAVAFETAGRARLIIFDKTGTLTAGEPEVTQLEVRHQRSEVRDENDLLRLVAAVEAPSEHPIARAIVRAAKKRNITIPAVREFRAIPGEGVRGVVEGREVAVVRDERATARIEADGEVVGTVMVADQLRPDAREAVDQLQAMGMQVFMLSGDRRAVAESVGAAVGLSPDQVMAEATPESKVKFVANRARDGAKPQAAVIMVGDGINDAAALAQADLGIALASGTNIAIESADVVIPGDRVTAVAQTIHIARQTLRTIRQNLFFAFFYNATMIPVAALGLLGMYGPLIAAAAMGASDITVIGNALRLRRKLRRFREMKRAQH